MTERVAAFEATPQRRRINSRASESEFSGLDSRIESLDSVEPVGAGVVKSGEESVSRNCVGDQAQ
jgi:hypothetical protein